MSGIKSILRQIGESEESIRIIMAMARKPYNKAEKAWLKMVRKDLKKLRAEAVMRERLK